MLYIMFDLCCCKPIGWLTKLLFVTDLHVAISFKGSAKQKTFPGQASKGQKELQKTSQGQVLKSQKEMDQSDENPLNIPPDTSTALVLEVIGLMCDGQQRKMQDYLREQLDNFRV